MKTTKEYLDEEVVQINETNEDMYKWKDINQAMMDTGYGAKVIIKLLMNLKGKKVKK